MSDDRYAKTLMHGKVVDKWTKQALEACERALGYDLTIVQGSYNGTAVSASAGTHAGGGVVDLAPYDAARKVHVLREHGFAAWHRLPSQGPWGEHIHAVLIDNDRAAASAKRQVISYREGRNGLANNARDDGPRVAIKPFPYKAIPERKHGMNNVEYGRMLIAAGIAELKKAKGRPVIQAAVKVFATTLNGMPKS